MSLLNDAVRMLEQLELPLPVHCSNELERAYERSHIDLLYAMQVHCNITQELAVCVHTKQSAPVARLLVHRKKIHPSSYGMVIELRESFLECAPTQSVVYALAHELAHVLLLTRNSPFQISEKLTDICAMALGYEHAVLGGRQYVEASEREQKAAQFKWWASSLVPQLWRSTVKLPWKTLGYLTEDEVTQYAELVQTLRQP